VMILPHDANLRRMEFSETTGGGSYKCYTTPRRAGFSLLSTTTLVADFRSYPICLNLSKNNLASFSGTMSFPSSSSIIFSTAAFSKKAGRPAF
jgi:hypothetical protein